MRKIKVAILGAGTAGLTAMSQVRKQTEDFVIIDGGTLGTTCARIGCMPSKALIHSANHYFERNHFADIGIHGAEQLSVNQGEVLQRVRALRDRFAGGVAQNMLDSLKPEQFIKGYAKFLSSNQLEVNGEKIEAERIIIATGSRPVVPAPWQAFGQQILTSDEIFELEKFPASVAVVGLGAIGIELGQAMARLGVKVIGFEMLNTVAGLSSPKAIESMVSLISKEFPLYLGEAANIEAGSAGKLRISNSAGSFEVDAVLAALGRRPNVDQLGLENLGVELDRFGLPQFDPETLQIENLPVFIAGDANRYRPILHEAGYEGKIAGLNAMQYPQVHRYHRVSPMGIVFTDPQVAVFGQRYSELDLDKTEVVNFSLERNNGRAIVEQVDKGVISLYADKQSKRLLGGELVMAEAEHLAHLLNWAVEEGLTVERLLQMPFYHPVLEEAVDSALKGLAEKLEIEMIGLQRIE